MNVYIYIYIYTRTLMGGGGGGARTHERPLQLRAYPRDHRFRPAAAGASTASTQQPGTRALYTTTPVTAAVTINKIPSLPPPPPPPSRPDSHRHQVDSRARGSSRRWCCCCCCCCSPGPRSFPALYARIQIWDAERGRRRRRARSVYTYT